MNRQNTLTMSSVVVCLLFLIIAEFATRLTLPKIASLEAFRDNDSGSTYALIDRPRKTNIVLWLVGDSTVLGLDLPQDETLGSQLQEALQMKNRDIEVRTVGLNGLSLMEAAAIANDLPLKPGDIVIFQIHFIYAMRDDRGLQLGTPIIPKEATWQENVESLFERPSYSSSIVRNRMYIANIPYLALSNLFPSLEAKITNSKSGPVRRTEWTTGSIPPQDLEKLSEAYSSIRPEKADQIIPALTAIKTFFGQKGVLVGVYINPLNRLIVDKYHYANWQHLSETAEAVYKGCRQIELSCLNLIDIIPGEFFFDDDHPDSRGYRIMVDNLKHWEILEVNRFAGK